MNHSKELDTTRITIKLVAIQKGPYKSGLSPTTWWKGGRRIMADLILLKTSCSSTSKYFLSQNSITLSASRRRTHHLNHLQLAIFQSLISQHRSYPKNLYQCTSSKIAFKSDIAVQFLIINQLQIHIYETFNNNFKMNRELIIDPASNTSMFSRTGSIRHSRLYSDRHASQRKRHSQTPQTSSQKAKLIPSAAVTGHFSPFNTVSRDSRNSYLLRVTHEPNVKTIYRPNFDFGKNNGPQFSFQKQKVVRKISNVTIDHELLQNPKEDLKKQCQLRLNKGSEIQTPLVIKDCLNYRKNHHEMDFSKQTSFRDVKSLTSTGFNTQQPSPRSTSKEHGNKSHHFSSYSPHKYLQSKPGEKKCQIFSASSVNWGIVKKNWNTRGLTPFSTYTNKIRVRQDRSEPAWNPQLDYDPDVSQIKPKLSHNVSFDQYTDRAENTEVSKYPMRLSQRKEYGMRKFHELKDMLATNRV